MVWDEYPKAWDKYPKAWDEYPMVWDIEIWRGLLTFMVGVKCFCSKHKILGHWFGDIISCYRRNALRHISHVFGDAPRTSVRTGKYCLVVKYSWI